VKRLAAYGEPVEGTPFGRYRQVWRAHDTATNNRTVAIKLLPPQNLAADHSAEASQEFAKNPSRRPLQNLPWPATDR
jgi:hypothetical protein